MQKLNFKNNFSQIEWEWMMDTDDLEPAPKKKETKNLEILSVEALNEYIAELEEEIQRTKDAIVLKDGARSNADSFFK
ncbi:MAG: DUF1192 domain-containing protein [Rhodospirillales bacterium]|jgi:uncharacterized small protein (DUF1192 family)|nr:DUF1192 domain-containing protein [Rhodospirillales bacterium]